VKPHWIKTPWIAAAWIYETVLFALLGSWLALGLSALSFLWLMLRLASK
jgi:hypothetical protein